MIDIKDNYEKIYDSYSEKLYRTILMYCNSKENTEDIIQNTFLKLYISDVNFESQQHIKNWLFRIAINDAKNFVKSRWHTYLPFEEKMCDISFVNNQSENSYIYQKLLRLQDKDRIVILLYYYDGYSVKEISKLLNIKESTIQTRLSRGREKLRKYLRK